MADQWVFKSETYDNCNCEINCGCQFNLPSTHGYCQSAFIGHIVEGHFNETPLTGLNWAGLYKWPGEIKDGNGKRQIVIDERADEAQRSALETIISGRACEPLSNFFSVFASTCSEFCETLFLPIELVADLEGRTARVEIPGILKSRASPKINEFNSEPFHIAIARPSGSFEFTYAELGLGSTSVTGRYGDGVRRYLGALLYSPLQSGWHGARKIKTYSVAWCMTAGASSRSIHSSAGDNPSSSGLTKRIRRRLSKSSSSQRAILALCRVRR